uniref:hypothetical protein n=1 Tax=Chroothece richteriana TaxID=101928 RepID=UPI001FCCC188|nr:hypothetical protein MW631_pgp154 [Chroothece richteriana]UNJ14154.1 hypothetical protein [Chroothece richteriana]
MKQTNGDLYTSLHQLNFQKADITQQDLNLIWEISEDIDYGIPILKEILLEHFQNFSITAVDGIIYETLLQKPHSEVQTFLQKQFPDGIVMLNSTKNIEYTSLQKALVNKDFLLSDKITQKKLCELANIDLHQRDWLYFTDVIDLPIEDLYTIDTLWKVHSLNRFGFSIQTQIWNTLKPNHEKLFTKIHWTINQNLCRYPQEFTWDISAPKGHLPLFNQLRGSQALITLLSHKAWKTS